MLVFNIKLCCMKIEVLSNPKDKLFLYILKSFPKFRVLLVFVNYILLLLKSVFFILCVFCVLSCLLIIMYGFPTGYVDTVLREGSNYDYSVLIFTVIGCVVSAIFAFFLFLNIKKTSTKELQCSTYKYRKLYLKQRTNVVTNLSNNERILLSILLGWLMMHITFYINCNGDDKYFWPFDRFSRFGNDYGTGELFVFGIIPIIVFLIYKLLNRHKY